MDIQNNKLTGSDTEFRPSPNRGGAFKAPTPDSVVVHFTAGGSLDSSVHTLSDPSSKASAHVVVGRDGKIVQLVPFDTVAWHAGVSSFEGRSGFNQFSIGIEIDNAGRLTQTASGDFLTWFMKPIAKTDAVQGVHRNESVASWWHAYTETQIDKVFQLCTLLIRVYGIKLIVGHEEIAPARKTDPGPAFPLDRLRDRLLGTGRNEDGAAELETGMVTASLLNARSGPSVSAALIGTPLVSGTSVQIAESRDGWLRLLSPVTAWVKEDYVMRETVGFPSAADMAGAASTAATGAASAAAAKPAATAPLRAPASGAVPEAVDSAVGARTDTGSDSRTDSGSDERTDTGGSGRPDTGGQRPGE